MTDGTELVHVPADTAIGARLLEALDDEVREYASASYADGTKRVYQSHWRTFVEWCVALDIQPIPTSPETLARYATMLAAAKRKWSTINVAMSTVNQANVTAGHPAVRDHALVQRVLRGIRRTLGVAPAQAAPFLSEHLKRSIGAFNKATMMGLRDSAMLAIGFFGAFRRSELVSLNINDFTLDSKGWIVNLRRSKTDQEGHGRRIGLPYASDPDVCPVRTLQAWLAAAREQNPAITEEAPAFLHIDNLRNKVTANRLTPQVVTRIVKQAAGHAGLDAKLYSAHSLRAGFITSATRAGKSIHAIRRQTGHNSIAMVDRYVREAAIFDDNAAIGLGL